ncbi:hypothetical protein FSP39_006154 [Pinctada imbricata]|uniref:Protein kinase domain-containing protein n=1 Tax=Pinctada imbricata TaxID=66713 RepID=A0AA89BKA9_PINIB|nr:hypothetical protein FSP39_006154 [Pinctada imbricata]
MKAIQCIRSPKSMFSMLPLDVISMVLRIDARDSFSIWSNISLADGEFQRMVSQHAEAQIPGLVLQRGFPLEKQIVGKRSDHAVWLRVKGTFMSRHEVDVMIFVTGRYPTRLKVNDQEDIEFGNTETEFDILRSIQYRQQHRNVVQLLAFCDPNPRSFAMFAVEKYECTLLKYLYAARSNNEELKLKWKVKRCLEMLNAIDFLHFHKIVHRDIMADVFSMRYNGPDPEVLVLTSFKRAIANDEAGNTTMIGHVRDLNSTQIPTRWSAPESFLQDRFDTYSDIWMLGHAIREIFTCGCQPYTEMYSEDTGDIMAKVTYFKIAFTKKCPSYCFILYC